jgi:hypothetical protein
MIFKKQNKINLQTHKKADFPLKREKEKSCSKTNKDRNLGAPFSSEVVDTSFVYFEEN